MAVLTPESCPRLAPGVTFEAGPVDGRWIVSAADVPVSRVSTGVVELLRSLDGRTPLRDIRTGHAPSLSDSELLALVRRFDARGLLAGGERRPPGRVVFRPPLTLQVATLHAPALFAALDRVRRLVVRRWMLPVVAVVVVAGAAALVVQAPAAIEVLTTPLSLPALLAVAATLVLATLVHEAAHGMTLAAHGPLPSRAGVMLLYLSPAFFVDVTNGWRLGARRARVAVALAGPIVHATLGSAAAGAAFVAPPGAREALLVLALAAWSIVVLNLVPFVRFDGYLALMSALDIPNLRASAIADLRDALAHRLCGAPRRTRRIPRPWVLPFGALSVLTPAALIVFALDRIVRALAAGGEAGAVAILAVAALAVVAFGVAVVREVRRLLADGARPLGVAVAGVVSAVVLGAVGAAIPVPTTVELGFVADRGEARLVVAGAAEPRIAAGDPVTLWSQGFLARRAAAQATVSSVIDARVDLPLRAAFPVDLPGHSIPGRAVAVLSLAGDTRPPRAGTASVTTGETSLWGALWSATVARPLTTLGVVAAASAPEPHDNRQKETR